MELDVTSPLDKLNDVAREAIAFYGRVDVLVNNAGYMAVGAIEESTPEETYDQFNTNLFGALNVTRTFLPYMRERDLESLCGWVPLAAGKLFLMAVCTQQPNGQSEGYRRPLTKRYLLSD